MLGNYLQQMTSAGDIFRCIFLGALRVRCGTCVLLSIVLYFLNQVRSVERSGSVGRRLDWGSKGF